MLYFQDNLCSALFISAYLGYKDIAELLIANGVKVSTDSFLGGKVGYINKTGNFVWSSKY